MTDRTKDEMKERFLSFFGKKFLIFFVILILASVFCWFGKMNEKYTMIIWIMTSVFYGFWNVLQKLVDQITLGDIRSILSLKQYILDIKESINGKNS